MTLRRISTPNEIEYFLQGLRQLVLKEPSLIPVVARLSQPHTKHYIQVYTDHHQPERCDKIMLIRPTIEDLLNNNKFNGRQCSQCRPTNYVYLCWCNDFGKLTINDIGEYLCFYTKGSSIEETDQRLCKWILATAKEPISEFISLILRYRKSRLVPPEIELKNYVINFCTMEDYA